LDICLFRPSPKANSMTIEKVPQAMARVVKVIFFLCFFKSLKNNLKIRRLLKFFLL